ncbi:MAG TPA: hypothetical protein VNT01_00560 [Symbiobacteriaceae bacterium]|nr:hypothetical protein [Symbiobacteriaceae bacterium]
MEPNEPMIYMPTEAAVATSPDGRKLVFFTVPQLDLLIKNVITARPTQYSYSWGYHPGHKVHVLLFTWPECQGAGIAIPEGTGDMVLNYMLGTTTVYITTEPVQDVLSGEVSAEQIQRIVLGNTVGLTDVKFKPEA